MTLNVSTEGFSVPPVPGHAAPQIAAQVPPVATAQVPGFVPAANADQTFTAAQVQEQIAAALAAAAPKPANVTTPATIPTAVPQSTEAASDEVLTAIQSGFAAIGPNVDMNRAFGNALTHGDATLIDVAYLKEVGGAQAAQLETLAKAIVARVQSQAEHAAKAAHTAAGGEANWAAAATAFNANAEPHLKQVVANMLNSGNPGTIEAAAKMVVQYSQQNGLVPKGAQLLNAGAATASAGQGLTKEAFQDANFKLDRNSRTYEQDRNSLFARRQLGKSLGM